MESFEELKKIWRHQKKTRHVLDLFIKRVEKMEERLELVERQVSPTFIRLDRVEALIDVYLKEKKRGEVKVKIEG